MSQSLKRPSRNKYNKVARALPYPSHGAAGCRWVEVELPSGRKIKRPA